MVKKTGIKVYKIPYEHYYQEGLKGFLWKPKGIRERYCRNPQQNPRKNRCTHC